MSQIPIAKPRATISGVQPSSIQSDLNNRRAFVIVIDACGVGDLPDSGDYGDAGANTLGHVAEAVGGLDLPVLGELGLGSIMPLVGLAPATNPVLHGKLRPLGAGKDTITGHWELMGVLSPEPMRTYSEGFPDDVLADLVRSSGRGVLCNRPYSGTAVIDDFGEEHLASGDLIVYTSADSVMQIAAHEEVVPRDELHDICAQAREIMQGDHTVGRVIARPFIGKPGEFQRTDGRRDFAVQPPARSYLQEVQEAGLEVHAVGKIGQVFTKVGISAEHAGATNAVAIASTTKLIEELDTGLVFTNLVETDQVYGHRNDPEGFYGALREIDTTVGEWLKKLDPQRDLLIITADHGCDPTTPGTDHTREHAPLLASFAGHRGRRHDGDFADVGASALNWLTGGSVAEIPGKSFI